MEQIKLNSKPKKIIKKGINTIDIILIFPFKYEDKDRFNLYLLKQLLSNTSKTYPNEQDFKKELLRRLIIGYSVGYKIYNKNLFYTIELTIPNPKKVPSFNLSKAIAFLFETIYNPNLEGKSFNKKEFDREKEYLESSLKTTYEDIDNYSFQKALEYVDDEDSVKITRYYQMEELSNSSPEEIYELYQKIISNNTPITYVYGEDTEDVILELSKYLKDDKEIIINTNYTHYLKPKEKVLEVEEYKQQYKESALYMAYKVENMKNSDEIYLMFLKRILGNNPNLVFQKIRLENNLAYRAGTTSWIDNGLLEIRIYLNSKDKEKAISLVNEIFEEIKNPEKINKYISDTLLEREYGELKKEDSKYYDLDSFIDKELKTEYSYEEVTNLYKNLEIDKFIAFLDRIKLDTIYLLRGDDSGK